MKGACEDEIIVCRELLEASLEVPLVDQASSLVDNDEGIDNPGASSQSMRMRRSFIC